MRKLLLIFVDLIVTLSKQVQLIQEVFVMGDQNQVEPVLVSSTWVSSLSKNDLKNMASLLALALSRFVVGSSREMTLQREQKASASASRITTEIIIFWPALHLPLSSRLRPP